MDPKFDCIVIGTGGVGSASLYALARRGANVLGLDQYHAGHDRGSSHGETRATRLAYFEHPDFVPLLRRAHVLWEQFQSEIGRSLYEPCGILQIGPRDGQIVPGVLKAASLHGLDVETLDASEIERRFPGLAVSDPNVGVFESRAGFLRVEECVKAYLDAATDCGAVLRFGETVQGWRSDGNGLLVETDQGRYRTDRLVVTAGAWATQLLASLKLPLQVLRKPVMWYRTNQDHYRVENGFPVWLFETPSDIVYGFPEVDGGGMKVGLHSGGSDVPSLQHLDRSQLRQDQQPLEEFFEQHLPGVSRECLRHSVCMYTMSPDQHFIVDRYPDDSRICFVAGLSGHGFKFANVFGEVMADLSLEGKTRQPIGFLSAQRFLS